MHTNKCQVCNKDFLTKIKTQRYCCRSCSNTGRSSLFISKPICKWCQKEFYRPSPSKRPVFCSKNCESKYRKKDRMVFTCEVCSHTKHIPQSQKNKRFCSKKCLGIDMKRNPRHFSPQYRSYGECAITCLLKKNYTNMKIITSDRTQLNGYELDIWIPELKIGIEYNGQHHYKPVYGDKIFKKTKNADSEKLKIAKKKGIKIIYIIPNGTVYTYTKSKIKNMFIECCKQLDFPAPTIFDLTPNEVRIEQKENKPSGQRFINLGRKHSKKTKQNMSKSRLKTYILRSPTNEIITVTNIREFCKDNNIQYTWLITQLKRGKSCKGWTKA